MAFELRQCPVSTEVLPAYNREVAVSQAADLANAELTTIVETRRWTWTPQTASMVCSQLRRSATDLGGPAKPPEKRKVGGSILPRRAKRRALGLGEIMEMILRLRPLYAIADQHKPTR
jgi:hypothetical protein